MTDFASDFYARQQCWSAGYVYAIGIGLVPANSHLRLMSRTPALSGVIRGAFVFLVLSLTAGWTNSAEATCGDYLHRDRPAKFPAAEASTSHHSLPCQGPGCRRSELPATPGAPSTLDRTSDHSAILSHSDSRYGDERTTRPRIAAAHGETGFANRIDRPPR